MTALVTMVVAGVGLTGTAVAARAVNRPAVAAAPALISVSAPSLFPEAVDFDRRRGRFLVGSAVSGTVSAVALDGSIRTLVSDPRLRAAVGIGVDAARDRVLVTDLATDDSVSGLASYELATGRRQWYVDLAATADDGGPHFTNDVAVGRDGTAYVVDGVSPNVFRVDTRGRASVLLRDARLGPTGALPGFQPAFGTTTVAWIGADCLLVSKMDGTLWRLPVHHPTALAPIAMTGAINVFVDGARVFDNGDVGVITNGWFGAPPSVQRLRLSGGARTARVASTVVLPDPLPTGISPGPGGTTYAMSGRLDLALHGQPSEGFTLRRVDF
jgi:hypothetical protein